VVKLKPFLKTYREAGSLNSLLAPHAFIDEHVFLTKANQLGVTFRVSGIDDECLTAETLDSYTKRIAAAFRGFSERFRIYQYIVKQDRAQIEQSDSFPTEAVRSTVLARREHLQSKASGLYTLDLYFVILYEPLGISDGAIKQAVRGLTKRNVSTKSVLRVAAHELAQSRDALMGQAISLQRTIGDLLGLQMLGKREVFSLFRLLCNLDPLLYGWGKKARLEAAAVDVVKIFGNHEGSLFRESYNALNAYLSIIPGNHAFSLRKTWLLSKNYADLSFVYAPYTGEKKNKHLGCERRSNNRPQRAA